MAEQGAFEDFDEAGAGGFAGGRSAVFAVAGELEQGGPGVAELEDLESEGLVAGFGGYDAADEVAGVTPEVEGAAAVAGVEGVLGVAEVEKGLAVFKDEGVGPLGEEGLDGVEDEFWSLRLDCSGGRHTPEHMPWIAGLPAFLGAEMGNVGDVVAGMPGVEQGGQFDGLRAAFGVKEGALPLGLVE